MEGDPQPLVHPVSQPESQQLDDLRPPNSLLSKPPHLRAGLQPLSQLATSQPQVGASQPQVGASQPQAGSQAESQHALFFLPNNLLSKPPPLGAEPQPLSQLGVSQPQVGASQPQAGSAAQPQGVSQPQAGSAAQPQGASASQAGSHGHADSAPQVGSVEQQGASLPQLGASQHAVSQPQPLEPNMRSNRSKPKLWVVIRQPKAIVKVKVIRFMKPRLPVAHALSCSRCFGFENFKPRAVESKLGRGRWTKSPSIKPQCLG